MMKKLLPFLFLACCSLAPAQDTIRICTYNVLNYTASNEDGRAERFERILREIKPDILVVQEIGDETGGLNLTRAYFNAMDGSMSPGTFGFHDGNDSDNMIFFNTKKFNYSTPTYHKTALRDIAEYPVPFKRDGKVEFLRIFSVHLKSDKTAEDEQKRLAEIDILQSKMSSPAPINTLVVGDFNFYSRNEEAYQALTMREPNVIDIVGHWVRDNSQFSHRFTQSPRMDANAACGGGTGGGMDDRFDFIFMSADLTDNYIMGSYTVFGNDGVDRRNAPINDPPNTKVSAQIADDLACASDHLPVYADFIFNKPTSVETPGFIYEIAFSETADFVTISLPSSGAVTVTNFNVTVTNILGQTVQVLNGNGGNQYIQKAGFAPGVYFIQANSKADAGSVAGWYKFVVAE